MGGKQQQYREALAWLQEQGWRVDTDRSGYPMAFCACGEHKRWVHITPSDPSYFRNLRAWVMRQPCMMEPDTQEGGS